MFGVDVTTTSPTPDRLPRGPELSVERSVDPHRSSVGITGPPPAAPSDSYYLAGNLNDENGAIATSETAAVGSMATYVQSGRPKRPHLVPRGCPVADGSGQRLAERGRAWRGIPRQAAPPASRVAWPTPMRSRSRPSRAPITTSPA
jgi:hypothetical protein